MADTNELDTNGWHTVAAITYADVNTAIIAAGTTPKTFQVTAPDGSMSAQGDFGFWSLALGGSGNLISLQIALIGGTVSFGGTSLPIRPCAFPVTVVATYIPHTDNADVSDLKVDAKGPVTVGTPIPSATGNELADAALSQLLTQWLTANLEEFNVVFASVDLDAEYEHESLSWLKPSYKGYAVEEPVQNASLENSVFAVLCLIDGATPSKQLSYQVSAFAIPDGARAAFLVSTDKFLQHMLIAAMPLLFEGIQSDPATQHFAIDNAGTTISNSGDLTMAAVMLDDGTFVSPSVNAGNFTVEVNVTQLVINVTDMAYDVMPGITVHFNYTGASTLGYDTTKQLMDLTVVNQTGTGEVTTSNAYDITQIVMGAVAVLGGILSYGGGAIAQDCEAAVESASEAAITQGEVVGQDAAQAEEAQVWAVNGLVNNSATKVTQIAARWQVAARLGMLGAVIGGDMTGIMIIAKALAQGDYQSMPKLTDLTDAAVGKTVIWPSGAGDFVLASAQLNNCLQLGLVKQTQSPA
jgi:hypothetical protein